MERERRKDLSTLPSWILRVLLHQYDRFFPPPSERQITPDEVLVLNKALEELKRHDHQLRIAGKDYVVNGNNCTFSLTRRGDGNLSLKIFTWLKTGPDFFPLPVWNTFTIDMRKVNLLLETGVKFPSSSAELLVSVIDIDLQTIRKRSRVTNPDSFLHAVTTQKTDGEKNTVIQKFVRATDFYTLLYAQTVAASSTDR